MKRKLRIRTYDTQDFTWPSGFGDGAEVEISIESIKFPSGMVWSLSDLARFEMVSDNKKDGPLMPGTDLVSVLGKQPRTLHVEF
jgi:hypothetical protein